MSDLSPTMQSAIYYARKHGNKIVRYPGGFWARTGWDSQAPWFGTSTINALVDRGVAEFTEWKEGRSRFPVEVTLKGSA